MCMARAKNHDQRRGDGGCVEAEEMPTLEDSGQEGHAEDNGFAGFYGIDCSGHFFIVMGAGRWGLRTLTMNLSAPDLSPQEQEPPGRWCSDNRTESLY